jgi:hypothetical protein
MLLAVRNLQLLRMARGGTVMKSKRIPIFLSVFVILIGLSSTPETLSAQTFTGPELLGRPTDDSVTVHVVIDAAREIYFQYGLTTGYGSTTAVYTTTANEPITVPITGLSANTKYYYRMGHRAVGGTNWTYRTGHSFYTQRAAGSTFKFTITTDGHVGILLGDANTQQQTLTNVGADNPDFHIDLGDTVAMDNGNTGGSVTSETAARNAYLTQRSGTYFGKISHSAPIFLVAGNHEQTEGWHRLVDNLPVWSINARKRYFLNPVPDDFYSGNEDNTTTAISGDHLLGNYYAWNWGDALFVVIDPFWYTTTKAENDPPTYGGGEDTGAGNGDRWDWTLGYEQYAWLRDTLEYSNAKYKFVFMHHPTGGTDDYIRGGAVAGTYCEWGGYNEDGTTWGFTAKRPTWDKPVHQMLVENGVSAVFHGHDHQFVYETRNGIVYQEVPSAGGANAFSGVYTEGNHGNYNTIKMLGNSGHLRISVTPTQATVDYIATTGGGVNYTYTISPKPSLYGDTGPFDCDVDGSDLADWIAEDAPEELNIAIFAANFGKTTCQ